MSAVCDCSSILTTRVLTLFLFMSMFGELQVKLSAGHKFDRDVELLIYYKDAHQPTAVVEAGQASAKPGELIKKLHMMSYMCWNKWSNPDLRSCLSSVFQAL